MIYQDNNFMPTKLSRYCAAIMETSWLVSVILVPVFFNVYSSRIFEPDKLTILRSISLIILAAWFVKIFEEGWTKTDEDLNLWEKSKIILKVPFILPVAVLLIVHIIATIFSVTPRVSFWGSYQRLQGTYTLISYLVIFAAIISNVRNKSQIERLLSTVIIASLPVSLYGVLQRYQIDPIPWGGDVSKRIASNLGNSIFIGAYLIMVFPITVMRIVESLEDLLQERGDLIKNFLRATSYVFIATLQVIALYFSGSRGPWLGWGASLVFLWLGLSLIWNKRWLTLLGVNIFLVAVVFLAALNIPGGPLQELQKASGLGRLGQLLDVESRTGRVRTLIWSGAVNLVLPHEPIEYPDGEPDRFNSIRPLIGYGPESMYVAYNPFYPPELTQVEKRNASPDRSHNETWDSLVITGLLGLIAYLFLFSSIVYFSLSWLGLIRSRNEQILFFGLMISGGLISSIIFVSVMGAGLFGVALPFGMIAGVLIYLILISLLGKFTSPKSFSEKARSYIILGLIAAIIAHYVEINFGIAIAATQLNFWVFTGLLFLAGFLFPFGELLQGSTRFDQLSLLEITYQSIFNQQHISGNAEVNPNNQAGKARKEAENTKSKSRKRQKKKVPFGSNWLGESPWINDALIYGFILSVLLTTIGFNMLSNSFGSTNNFEIIWNSITRAGKGYSASSFGVLIMVVVTWVTATLVFASETVSNSEPGDTDKNSQLWKSILVIMGISFLFSLIFWVIHASYMASLAGNSANSLDSIMRQVEKSERLLTNYYIYLLALLFIFSIVLPKNWPEKSFRWKFGSIFSGVTTFLLAVLLASYTNLRVIQADMAFKAADSFSRSKYWPIAIQIYNRSIDLAPNEDYYYLFLGRAYLEHAKEMLNAGERDALISQAAQDLKKAQLINPLNTDHTANLARLFSLWAAFAGDNEIKQQRADTASDYFSRAVVLSPNNARIWDEWALHYLAVEENLEEALPKLQEALELDPFYDWTYGLLGDYYSQKSETISDNQTEKKKDTFLLALDNYQKAAEFSEDSTINLKSGYYAALAGIFIQLGDLDQAILAYEQAVQIYPNREDAWRILETLAHLYLQQGDTGSALFYAQNAHNMAPEDQKERLGELISIIKNQN
jgi:tetratricopeptide (TPR) repeat protein